jgi:hypothetical protein
MKATHTFTADNSILGAILSLIAACGPQSFSAILHEVRTQCQGVDGLKDSHSQTKAHLAHLISLRSIVSQSDDLGIVYGRPGDF